MKTSHIVTIGLMLFAMFFGAGNLIFPPVVGFYAGDSFLPAVLGFILTGVGLPLLAVIGASLTKGGYREALKKIHPLFSAGLLVIIYLTIGPFFAIPRTATTAYEMGVLPFLPGNSSLALFITSVMFFIATLYLVLRPDNLVDNIGKYLTPALLITISIIIIRVLVTSLGNGSSSAYNNFENSAFGFGFTEGYLTMDALAAMVFAILVINAINKQGFFEKRIVFKSTIQAALIAAFLLAAVYGSLALMGNTVILTEPIPENQNIGTYLLQYMSHHALGDFGIGLLGIAVLVACLTTSSGLISAVSEYFHSIIPSVSYYKFAVIFTVISLIIANLGLDAIIAGSVPILSLIYPVAMSAVFLLLFAFFVPSPRLSLQVPIVLVLISSALGQLHRLNWIDMPWLEYQLLYSNQLEWLPLLVIGYLVGYLIAQFIDQPSLSFK